MKHLKALMIFAMGMAFVTPALAETQNVKVSGSLDIYSFYRQNYDLRNNNDASVVPVGVAVPPGGGGAGSAINRSDADQYFRSNIQLQVAADLSDNVAAVISLDNQRDWNAVNFNEPLAGNLVGTTGARNTDTAFDVEVDLAYLQMKEVFYTPLTLTIGRQDIWLGRGFIIGNNNTSWDNHFSVQADEYSVNNAFDAIRGTLDFNPWTIDLAYVKIQEGSLNAEDDTNLMIANVNYRFDKYNAVAEMYYIGEFDRNTVSSAGGTRDNDTNTLGGRFQLDPISQVTIGAEYAYQFGSFRSPNAGAAAAAFNPERDRQAWATDIFATYRFNHKWKPELTLEYVVFSGEDDLSNGSTQAYHAWNFLYRGKFWTAIADFREVLYATADTSDQAATQNEQFIQLKGSMKPLDDLLLEASYTMLWNDVPTHSVPQNRNLGTRASGIGSEVDLQATYDYTEDVTLGLLAGWFFPGSQYVEPFDATATDVVSSVKVSF